jgi:hypothetical protein
LRKMPRPLAQQLEDGTLLVMTKAFGQVATRSENWRWEEGGAEEMLLNAASHDTVHPPPRAEGDLGMLDGNVNAEVHLPHLERGEHGRVETVVDVGLVGGYVGAVDGTRIDDDGVCHGRGAARTKRRQPAPGAALACPH